MKPRILILGTIILAGVLYEVDYLAFKMFISDLGMNFINIPMDVTKEQSIEKIEMCLNIINDEFNKKTEALMKYKIAMRVVDYVHFCEKLNAYHHYTILREAGYAERFFNMTTSTFIKLQKTNCEFIN